jgi:hypothetical protein
MIMIFFISDKLFEIIKKKKKKFIKYKIENFFFYKNLDL